jgi:hypothetical protein
LKSLGVSYSLMHLGPRLLWRVHRILVLPLGTGKIGLAVMTMTMSQVAGRGRAAFTESCGVSVAYIAPALLH